VPDIATVATNTTGLNQGRRNGARIVMSAEGSMNAIRGRVTSVKVFRPALDARDGKMGTRGSASLPNIGRAVLPRRPNQQRFYRVRVRPGQRGGTSQRLRATARKKTT
jgi:hypothetical protein